MHQFHVLSFEGPDAYARAGGIASRITGLTQSLGDAGFDTHLWFVGDPREPGHETCAGLHLHRWCHWLSEYHGAGVYDGENEKVADYARSLPPFLINEHLLPHLSNGGTVSILAEEWHTADAVLHLDWLLRGVGLRHRVQILWNANNTFGFDRIDWSRLSRAATITTVSRYMKHLMRPLGVDPLVIPNGIEESAFRASDHAALIALRSRLGTRPVLVKVARFDPDKRWLLAIDTVAELKRRGRKPLLLARGGIESHGQEVTSRARDNGLVLDERNLPTQGARGLLDGLNGIDDVDVLFIQSHVDIEARRLLFQAADAVLANSGHEPFGLVGLEVMAAEGVACTGCSGEDYAVPGQNALVLETEDPTEFVRMYDRLAASDLGTLRVAGKHTAEQYVWNRVIERALLPRLDGNVRANYRAPTSVERQISS
jgi:glycosyltransferase involved in cell wall biosynthesis